MGSHSNKFNSLRYSIVIAQQFIFKMMKLAVIALCLFAAVIAEPESEASPEAYYGHHAYGLGYRGYGYGRYGYGYAGYGYPYHGYGGYGYGGYRGKRSADADPAVFYGASPYAYHPYGYGYAPYAYAPLAVASGVSHQHVSTPAATYGIHQLHKRDAEADASPDAYYGYAGYGYGYPYSGYGYSRYGYGGYYGRYAGYGYGRGYGYGK